MSKVFEALQRQQQNPSSAIGRDPLAAETGTPDAPSAAVADANDFDLPAIIGAPVSPRSNEGALFPALNQTTEERPPAVQRPAPPATNGKAIAEAAPENGASARRPTTASRNQRSNDRPRFAPPIIRRVEPEATSESSASPTELHHPQSTIRAEAPPARSIPVEKIELARLHPRLIVLTEPQAPECEQYRTLRTQLFHAAERQTAQVITLTSALAGEGKTSTALNLALAIAQSKEKRVLLVDGDLRHPNVAPYLGARSRPGLGEVLDGEGEALEHIFCLDEPELCVLPIKCEVNNPTELLSSERLPEMLARLREYFDFIIIDSPPVMPFADARLLANHADAVILVVRAALAPYDTVAKAIDLLPTGRILGVVLNGAEHLEETSYYDYYYNYNRRAPHRAFFDRLTRRFRDRRSGKTWRS